MTKNLLLVLGPAELEGLLREYPDKLISNECIAITPDAYEYSKKDYRLKDIKYPKWVQNIRTFSVENYRKIEEKLIKLEENSYKKRAEIFEEKITKVDWNYQSNSFLLSMIYAASSFAEQCYEQLEKYNRVEIIALGHASEFYFDGCMQPAIICQELQKKGINADLILLDERAKAITHQNNLYEMIPQLNNEDFKKKWASLEKSVLIATSAIYSKLDQQKLIRILNENYTEEIRLVYPLPLWNVINSSEIFNDKKNISDLIFELELNQQNKCIKYSNWLTKETEKIIVEITESENRILNPLIKMQLNRLHKRHLMQVLTYINIKEALKIHKPEMIALTIQDSTINGPLASAAEILEIQKIIFPHSRVINWRTQSEAIVVTEWWQPNESRTLWGNKNKTIYFDTETRLNQSTEKPKQKSWMVLYNGVQENIANSVAWPFIKEVVNFVNEQAKKNRVIISHRLKPGDQTPIETFCELLDLVPEKTKKSIQENLQDLLVTTDLVISIDEPSSALWDAMIMGCTVLLVTDRELMIESLSDHNILPPLTIEKFKELIISFVSDEINFINYKNNQQKKIREIREIRINKKYEL
jgi:hypothetical protein